MQIAINFPALAHDKTLTFTGMLRKFFIEQDDLGNNIGISKNWNDDTKGKYIRQYEKRLIPVLTKLYGEEKPIHSYTEEEFERVLSELDRRYHYSENTIQHYRHLIWVVYKAGFEHDYYVDNLSWADIIDLEGEDPAEREELKAKVMTRTRRSFSIEEELRIIDWFLSLDPETATGEDIGLLFMFFEGLRNNEACGANLAGVHTLRSSSDFPVFDMVQSTVLGGNRVKGGGKTRNAPRVLPLLRCFYAFLQRRRAFLEKLVNDGKLILGGEIDSVDKIPFVCRGNSFLTRATTTDLSKAGRRLFERIGIDKRTLAVLHQILCSDEFKDLQLDEKEPTSYLFRRNFATHLYLLGYSREEIQYLIGHDIENQYISRNSFADEDALQRLCERMELHPVNELLLSDERDVPFERVNHCGGSFHEAFCQLTPFEQTNNKYDIQVDALEPEQPINVVIEGEGVNFDVVIRTSTPPTEYARTANIFEEHRAAYRRRKTVQMTE